MKFLVVPRMSSLLMYAKPLSIRYTSSVQVMLDGDEGIIHTLNGTDFYRLLAENGLAPFENMGVSNVRASVSPGHVRLMDAALRGHADVLDLGPCKSHGLGLHRVHIRAHGQPPRRAY
ncbi:MAG: hypothetical protein JWQ88_2979 [Rhodoferax sp.]|nr:hypothetical protein [Rhodoferax sp.]